MFWLVDGVNRPHKVTHFLWDLFAFPQFFRGKGVGEVYSWFVNEGKNASSGRERGGYWTLLLLILNIRYRDI